LNAYLEAVTHFAVGRGGARNVFRFAQMFSRREDFDAAGDAAAARRVFFSAMRAFLDEK